MGAGKAETGATPAPLAAAAAGPATATALPPLKQIEAGLLRVGYAEVGPATGQPVLLLHGWPYDIHTYVEVAPPCWRRSAIG